MTINKDVKVPNSHWLIVDSYAIIDKIIQINVNNPIAPINIQTR